MGVSAMILKMKLPYARRMIQPYGTPSRSVERIRLGDETIPI